MTKVGFQVQKRVVMAVTAVCIMISGCDDRFDSRGGYPSGEGKPVDVTLRIGLADEVDAYDLSASVAPSTKANASGDKAAFRFDLQPSAQTRAEGTSLKPEKLYNLEIRQYDAGGTCKNGSASVVAEAAIGSAIEVTLEEALHCQLVLVAWGDGNMKRLNGVSLKDAQKISVDASWISSLDPAAQSDMNKMPYILHLKDVNVASNGRIYSQDGEAIDIRLRLQRLAARLNVKWNYHVIIGNDQYQMNQILLQSIPLNYNVIPAPDAALENTYPSLLDQFTTIQLKDVAQSGSYSCWIPANVRGTNPNATSLSYRIKSNAPTGSSYIDFQAVNQTDAKKKLSYRVYLGGNDPRDFNLYGNRDYSYAASFTHTILPNADERVTIIDPIPASEDNKNLVPTANCFMVAPGGAFCFNPYTYKINGTESPNTLLRGWCGTDNRIQSVKVLWQTKENGDVGDPVLGVVTSATDHTNIVDVTDGTDFDKARIYCRVAPNTSGGSGLIAAYASADGTGDPLWSWHIWVTDYAPDATGNKTVLIPKNKRKLKFTYQVSGDQLPMMDRNLGAIAGYTLSDPPKDILDMSKANGFHYQWGRKDPFPSSYSADPISVISGLTSKTVPPKGMLNRYGPDGIVYVPLVSVTSQTTVRNAFQHPTNFYIDKIDWCSESGVIPTLWNLPNNDSGLKTYYDPCPAGWRVISNKNLSSFFTASLASDGTMVSTGNENFSSNSLVDAAKNGGAYFYYSAQGSGEATYVRLTGYWRFADEFYYIGQRANFWLREHIVYNKNIHIGFALNALTNPLTANMSKNWYPQDAHTTRCIQEKAN